MKKNETFLMIIAVILGLLAIIGLAYDSKLGFLMPMTALTFIMSWIILHDMFHKK
jgi:hypothetical protein